MAIEQGFGTGSRRLALPTSVPARPGWAAPVTGGSARSRFGLEAHPALLAAPVPIPAIERAWPLDWENRPIKDQCQHRWEIVVIDRLFNPAERVARCSSCHTPRCGYADDADPCVRRRHHDGGCALQSALVPVRRTA